MDVVNVYAVYEIAPIRNGGFGLDCPTFGVCASVKTRRHGRVTFLSDLDVIALPARSRQALTDACHRRLPIICNEPKHPTISGNN